MGACVDGVRICDELGEFWGPCEGYSGPAPEDCADGLDNDRDGAVDEGPGSVGCALCGPSETCDDGADNDCDGFVDEDCDPCAPTETCDNGLDDNCDGAVDEGCVCLDMDICENGLDDDCNLVVDDCACIATGDERCGDGLDNDCNGQVDEECAACEPDEICQNGVDDDCNGLIDDGCDACQLFEFCFNDRDDDCDGVAEEDCICLNLNPEVCGNGADDDCDGAIDEQPCEPDDGVPDPCNPNLVRACFGDNPAHIGVGPCAAGEQRCAEDGRWGPCVGAVLPVPEICDNGIDEDCEGHVDQCVIEMPVNLNGDCITTRCPENAPFPVGCQIQMAGGDERGGVASRPDNPVVYFQEGDRCGAGHVEGTLRCSNVQGEGLNEGNCRINKDVRYYPADRSGCPDTD